jgi:hypothetical protein
VVDILFGVFGRIGGTKRSRLDQTTPAQTAKPVVPVHF